MTVQLNQLVSIVGKKLFLRKKTPRNSLELLSSNNKLYIHTHTRKYTHI